MKKFRPQQNKTLNRLRHQRRTGQTHCSNWQTYQKWYPACWLSHQQHFANTFYRLHYLACHAPLNVQIKWRKKYLKFLKTHFGDNQRASVRYLNAWSCHSWL